MDKKFEFDPVEHKYTLDGKPLNGVTTILGVIAKPALIQWSADEACKYIENATLKGTVLHTEETWDKIMKEARVAHRKKKEKAGTLGTEAHAAIEKLINWRLGKGEAPNTAEMSGPVKAIYENFFNWSIEKNVKFLESERRLYSEKHWYAGTADIVCEINGQLFVGDVKTSSAIYPDHFIQASAYAAALVEMELYPKFDGVLILNCRKDGTFEYKFNYDLEGNFECFKACLTIHRQLEAINPNQ